MKDMCEATRESGENLKENRELREELQRLRHVGEFYV